MAKNRTEKSKYQSRYRDDSFVTAAQYITELICEKEAQIEYKELPKKFWQIKKWANKYKYQIKHANRLLSKYPEQAIIKALLDPRTKRIFSLAHPILENIISTYVKTAVDTDVTSRELTSKISMPSTNFQGKTVLSKLKDIENEL